MRLAKEAGIALTPAGASFPYGEDPRDRNIRLAPSFPVLAEVETAMAGVATCVALAAAEQLVGALRRRVRDVRDPASATTPPPPSTATSSSPRTPSSRRTSTTCSTAGTPPRRAPARCSTALTAEEQLASETIEDRIPQEVPDPDSAYGAPENESGLDEPKVGGEDPDAIDAEDDWLGDGEVGTDRAGRLVSPDEGLAQDDEKDLLGDDVGVDGAAASAEEAAVHVVDEDSSQE